MCLEVIIRGSRKFQEVEESVKRLRKVSVLFAFIFYFRGRYIYEGRLELKEGNVEKVYLANILLDVTGLTEKCIEFMILHIDDDNWDQRFRFARTQKPPYLIQEVINFISQDYLSYLRSPQFLNMRKEDVSDLIYFIKLIYLKGKLRNVK